MVGGNGGGRELTYFDLESLLYSDFKALVRHVSSILFVSKK